MTKSWEIIYFFLFRLNQATDTPYNLVHFYGFLLNSVDFICFNIMTARVHFQRFHEIETINIRYILLQFSFYFSFSNSFLFIPSTANKIDLHWLNSWVKCGLYLERIFAVFFSLPKTLQCWLRKLIWFQNNANRVREWICGEQKFMERWPFARFEQNKWWCVCTSVHSISSVCSLLPIGGVVNILMTRSLLMRNTFNFSISHSQGIFSNIFFVFFFAIKYQNSSQQTQSQW